MTDDSQLKRPRGYLAPEDRSEFGNWLLDAMDDMSFEQLAANMAERGHVHTPSYYIAMSGRSKKPGRVIRRALEEYFGGASTASAGVPSQSALVVAIFALVDEMRQSREEQARWNKGVEEALASLRGSRAPAAPRDDLATQHPEDAQPERPAAKHRTQTTRSKTGRPRPGWDEEPAPELESRSA